MGVRDGQGIIANYAGEISIHEDRAANLPRYCQGNQFSTFIKTN